VGVPSPTPGNEPPVDTTGADRGSSEDAQIRSSGCDGASLGAAGGNCTSSDAGGTSLALLRKLLASATVIGFSVAPPWPATIAFWNSVMLASPSSKTR